MSVGAVGVRMIESDALISKSSLDEGVEVLALGFVGQELRVGCCWNIEVSIESASQELDLHEFYFG